MPMPGKKKTRRGGRRAHKRRSNQKERMEAQGGQESSITHMSVDDDMSIDDDMSVNDDIE
jgi:hypothetical protein